MFVVWGCDLGSFSSAILLQERGGLKAERGLDDAIAIVEPGTFWPMSGPLGLIGPGLPEDYARAGHSGGDWLPSNEARVLKGHEGPVFAVRFNKAGTYCLTCGKVSCMAGCFCAAWHPCVWCCMEAGAHTSLQARYYGHAGHGELLRPMLMHACCMHFCLMPRRGEACNVVRCGSIIHTLPEHI